jgi:hypothetical protein
VTAAAAEEPRTRRIELEDGGTWDRREVVDAADQVIGSGAEEREWLRHTSGHVVYRVACRPKPLPAAACRTSTADTLPAVLDELVAHRRKHL